MFTVKPHQPDKNGMITKPCMYLQRKINKNKQTNNQKWLILFSKCNGFMYILVKKVYLYRVTNIHWNHIILQIRENTSFLNVSTSIAKLIGRGGGVIFILRRLCLLHHLADGVGWGAFCVYITSTLCIFQFQIHVYVTI